MHTRAVLLGIMVSGDTGHGIGFKLIYSDITSERYK